MKEFVGLKEAKSNYEFENTENIEENREDTNSRDVKDNTMPIKFSKNKHDSGIFISDLDNDLGTTGDTDHNYHNSDKIMETTSTDTTLLPSVNKSSFEYATPTTFSNNELPNIPLPLDVPDGFLNEWWLIFWDLYNSLCEHNSEIPYGNSFE
ncbi:hypothetical protein C1645_779234 [Glomus cerebriforme]|uniref:Uncharacterized protein n=1 Tax=Glomus cerebriforme TaxID=658196 RepID=A0A397SV64_9GLOM|nr:hypothetical protein C1645_779234 [Glomus cerebriforme]